MIARGQNSSQGCLITLQHGFRALKLGSLEVDFLGQTPSETGTGKEDAGCPVHRITKELVQDMKHKKEKEPGLSLCRIGLKGIPRAQGPYHFQKGIPRAPTVT